MEFFTVRKIWLVLLFLPTGVGVSLGFTLLESSETWLQILVAVAAMAFSFLAGLLSTGLTIAALAPVMVLICLAAAFGLSGVPSSDVEPIAFTILLSLIYGGIAYFAFGAGWVVRGLLVGFNGGGRE